MPERFYLPPCWLLFNQCCRFICNGFLCNTATGQRDRGAESNGATVGEILVILNRDFLAWVLLSFLLACPIAYIFVNSWLQGFRVRTEMSWWVFAGVGVIVVLVALITVSYQTWKAATVNPVKALKTD